MTPFINNFLSSTQATAQTALSQLKETLVQKLSPTEQKVAIAAFAALSLLTLGILICCRVFFAAKVETSQNPPAEKPKTPLVDHKEEPLVVAQKSSDSPSEPRSPKVVTLTEKLDQQPVETPEVKETPKEELAPKVEETPGVEEKAPVETEKPATAVVQKGTEPKETEEEKEKTTEKQVIQPPVQEIPLPTIVNEAPPPEEKVKPAPPQFKSPNKIKPRIREIAAGLNLFGSRGPSEEKEKRDKIEKLPKKIPETEQPAARLAGLKARPKGPKSRHPRSRVHAEKITEQPLETSAE